MSAPQDQVAIVGMAALFPGAGDLGAYWCNLRDGVDAITDLPAGRWDERFTSAEPAPSGVATRPDRMHCRRGGFVDDLAAVETTRFGIMPNSVPGTEPDQLIALQIAADAIEDAGGERTLPADRTRVGVILGRGGYPGPGAVRMAQRVRTANQIGVTLGELIPGLDPQTIERICDLFAEQSGPFGPDSAIGLVPNLAASRVANRLDLQGPAYTVDAACASSLVAVDSAAAELTRGRCDVVLAGGVHHCHDITLWSTFTQLGALSPSQQIRPLDRRADGLLIGEGTGMVVLKRLADAERDGDRIYAVIRGTGVASDGRAVSLMNPSTAGQVRAMRLAWQGAGLDPTAPGAVGLLEAHGTATLAGDAAELATLAELFGEPGAGEPPAVIGSVKSMIGHAMPAAGIAGLIKCALAVHHATLLPTLHCTDPNPALRRTRFAPIATAQPWERSRTRRVRRAGVNAFGFGGINAHVLIEEPPAEAAVAPPPPSPRAAVAAEPERVLRLAAGSVEQLAALLDTDDASLVRAAADEPAAGPVRLAVAAPDARSLGIARKAVRRGGSWRGKADVWFSPEPLLGAGGGKLAFVFPGLEAEFEPRVADVAEHFGLPPVPDLTGSPVGDVGRHGIAVMRLGRLLHAALDRMKIVPDGVAGHSIGEWVGMACAGFVAGEEVDGLLASSDPAALRVPGVTFAVCGAPAERVSAALAGHPDVVISHDNAPNQTIVCGPDASVHALLGELRRAGTVAQVLPFQSGFHTPMLEPCLDSVIDAVRGCALRTPAVPMWSATTAREYPEDHEQVRELFVRHLLSPVRFRPMVEAMHAAGFTAFIQVGVGQLGSLISDILRGREHLVVPACSGHRDGLAQLRRVAAALWVEGASPDPLAQLAAPPRRTASAPAAPGIAAPARKGPLVRLDLTAPLVSLPEQQRPLIRLEPPTERREAPRPGGFTGLLRVSTRTMPYLLDHCFYAQREGWPDDRDRFPVMPATTIVAQFVDVAGRLAGERGTVVAVRDVHLSRWLPAAPPTDVQVTATPAGPGRLAMAVKDHASATVEIATGYPAPPQPWSFDAAAERVPEHTAAQLYGERWMFHGPAYQGVVEFSAIGDRHVRAAVVTPPAPGGLLDSAGQVLAYWILVSCTRRVGVLPIGFRAIRFFGPHPPLGAALDCAVRITGLDENTLRADIQLVAAGRVWAEITGWTDRRFDNDPVIAPVVRSTERSTLSRSQPGGWELLFEPWSDLASRELLLRNQTSEAERADHERCPPQGRRHWLLGRIAVKDAVRRLLWDFGAGPVFPAEIRVANDESGRPLVCGLHGRELPELCVSLAHSGEAGVAIARQAAEYAAVGIDIEIVRPHAESTQRVALGDAERELLRQACAQTREPEELWFTRFWAAKEAAAKAEGTGLGHRPQAFAVRGAQSGALVVAGPRWVHHVRTRQVSNPPELPERRYVVAWTAQPRRQRTPQQAPHGAVTVEGGRPE